MGDKKFMTKPKIIIGKKAALEFIKLYSKNPNEFRVNHIYLKEGFSKKFIDEFYKIGLENKIIFKPKSEFDKEFSLNHQGIIIEYFQKNEAIITLKNGLARPPKNISIKQMLKHYPGIYVVTDRIQDPHNLGSMIRTVEALGGMALFVSGKGASLNETVQKVATSSLLYLPVVEISNPFTILEEAKKLEYWIIATTTKKSEKTVLLNELQGLPKENQKYILLVGSESHGLKKILLDEAHFWLEIPLLGQTESLNVNQALSILLYKFIEYLYL
jgi:23S rRNA (guanosine2251-2'-O)-methyltransferase